MKIIGYLWFNSSKEEMRRQLKQSQNDSGVGITISSYYMNYFDPQTKSVKLEFDDRTHGIATVKKDSWNDCHHLIDDSIGSWSRKNGLWEKKLTIRSVPVRLEVVKPFEIFRVLKT